MTRAPPHFRPDFCESDRRLPARFERSCLTVMGQEARYSVPEKLPDALISLVDQLDDLQEQETGRHLFVSNVAPQRLRIYSR
jgi:hypothetical protein